MSVTTIPTLDEEKKLLIKNLFCKNCTDSEVQLFFHACLKTGLDPFMKQIYAIKRKDTLTIQTAIDGLRLIAERTGNYSPGKETEFAYDEKGHLISATAYIKKRTSDQVWHEVAACAYFSEYNPGQGLWQKMPRAMLSKCAEALALRKAFPAEMSGLYTDDEMAQADKEPKASKETVIHPPIDEKEQPIQCEISEEQWADLDYLSFTLKDKEYEQKVAEFIGVSSLHKIKTERDYGRAIRALERRIKAKEEGNGSSNVA